MIRKISVMLLIFNSISALVGGAVLIIDPSGGIMQLPLELLSDSLFANFLIPGIVLFIILGIGSTLAAFTAIKRTKKYYIDTITVGICTLIWILVEFYTIRVFDMLQLVYGFIGSVLVVLGGLESRGKKSVI